MRRSFLVNFVFVSLTSCATSLTGGGRAAYEELPPRASGPAADGATIRAEGVWSPAEGVALHAVTWCTGEGFSRACRVEISRSNDGGSAVIARELVGSAMPQLGVSADRTMLVLAGEDGRGVWRQYAQYVGDTGAVQWSRRRYDSGL